MQELRSFLSDVQTLLLFTRLIFGAIAVFFAILSWRKTNESYMFFFIIGIFFDYASILYKTIKHFGFIGGEILSVKAISIGLSIFENIPILCFTIGFILFLKSKKF